MTDASPVDFTAVGNAIENIIAQNQRPSTDKIRAELKISDNKFDQVIDYYTYLWEQRHTTMSLDTIDSVNPSVLQTKDLIKRASQLEESLAMMRATIEATEDCLLITDEQGKMIGFNKKFIEMFKLPESILASKDEADGLNYVFGQLQDPQELYNLLMQKYQDHSPGGCGEMFFKDGRVVERYYQPQIIDNKVVGHVWSLRDVTIKRKQEEYFRLTSRAMMASTHGIMLVENNSQYIITYLNPAGIDLFHVREGEVLKKPFLNAILGFSDYSEDFLQIFDTQSKGVLTVKCPIGNKILWLEVHLDPVYDKDEKTISHFVAIINDVTKNKELENILQYKTVHDALTGLPNKAYVEDAIRYRIKNVAVSKAYFSLMFIDIDRFKNVNDTLGHGVGDQLLCLFGKRLQNCVQKKDVIARIGGDEFIILIHNVLTANVLNNIAKRLLEACRRKFTHLDHEFNISASIGIVQYPECGNDPETLIRNADIAMYQAKFSGRNRACFYTSSLNRTMSRRIAIENELHDAIKNNEFELHYQPIYNIAEKKYKKAESLLRWKNKKLGSVSPVEFIPIAEDIGMMTSIGRWIIETGIAQQKQWQEMGINNLVISINVSAKQLLDENFVQHVSQMISLNGVESKKIIFEITESFFLLKEKISEKLGSLTGFGIKIAIDDFGTGYSNLSYLNKLHVSYLKIDKSFIDQIDYNQFDDTVLLAIIAIGKRMKFKIIAEGVETKNQFLFLKKNGCDEIQGYYFSKPLPVIEFEKFIQK